MTEKTSTPEDSIHNLRLVIEALQEDGLPDYARFAEDGIWQIERLSAQVERMTAALRFYQNGFRYHPKRTSTGIDLSSWKPKDELLEDCGETARAALSSTNRQEGK